MRGAAGKGGEKSGGGACTRAASETRKESAGHNDGKGGAVHEIKKKKKEEERDKKPVNWRLWNCSDSKKKSAGETEVKWGRENMQRQFTSETPGGNINEGPVFGRRKGGGKILGVTSTSWQKDLKGRSWRVNRGN